MSQTEFFSWYSSMEFSGETDRTVRWNQVQAVIKSPNRHLLETMTRLAFRAKVPATDAATVRAQFSEGAPPPGDEELSLLAASSIATILERRDGLAAKAALITAAATFAGMRLPVQPMNLGELAENALRELSETARRRPSLELQRFTTVAVDPKPVMDAVQGLDIANIQSALNVLALGCNKALSSIATRQRQFEAATQQYVQVQDEELDILWWIQGGRSEVCDAKFEDIPTIQLPLLFASELADLTTVEPGPSALAALLSRAGIGIDVQTTVAEAVQSIPANLLSEILPESLHSSVSPAITPVLEAVRRRQELEGNEGWTQAWDQVCGLSHQAQVPSLKLAEAAYRELLVVSFE